MLASKKYWRSIMAALAVVVMLVASITKPVVQASSNPHPGVVPPEGQIRKLYEVLSAQWWRWALSIPADRNPVLDTTGEHCDEGQKGGVWFLAGTFGGSASRTCTVPAGRLLFFPIINGEWDNLVCGGPDTNLTVEELRNNVKSFLDGAINLACEIDGVPIQGLNSVTETRYRVQSPVFAYTLPENNIYQFFDCDIPARTVFPAVGDGVYLMLAPLPVGSHTIHFHAEHIGGFGLDVTYNLTVTLQ